jgi:hypothetical protein
VLLRSGRARDLRVSDIANEQMVKRVLALVSDRGATLAPHELLALETVEHLFGFGSVQVTDLLDRAEPEDLADHRGVLQE